MPIAQYGRFDPCKLSNETTCGVTDSSSCLEMVMYEPVGQPLSTGFRCSVINHRGRCLTSGRVNENRLEPLTQRRLHEFSG